MGALFTAQSSPLLRFSHSLNEDCSMTFDFTDVITDISAAAVAIVGVLVVVKGARLVFTMLR